MGMTTNIVAFPPNDRWRRMQAIWEACEAAGVAVPDEVDIFFGGESPDPLGAEVDIDCAIEKWHDDSAEGYQIDIAKLPNDIQFIRFYIS